MKTDYRRRGATDPDPEPRQRVIRADTLYSRLEFFPHDGQRRMLASPARFFVADCGRRWGKSLAGPHKNVPKMLLKKPTLGWIVAPTYDLGEKEFRVFWNILIDRMRVPIDKSKTYYSTRTKDFRITTSWGSSVEVRSAEHPESLVGEGLDWVIMAEAAKLKLSHWEKYIRPTLADKRGSADFVSTPEGFNWFYQIFKQGEDPDHPNWDSIQSPTWENTVMFPLGREDPEILEIEKTTPSPEVFNQEYGADFTSFAGRIYSDFDEGYHVLPRYQFNPNWPNYLAFDFGLRNVTACLNIQVDPEDNVYVWKEYYEKGLNSYTHATKLRSLINWRVDRAYRDPSGSDQAGTIMQVWRDVRDYYNPWLSGVDLTPAPNDVEPGIQQVQRWLKLREMPDGSRKPKLFVAKECRRTINEFNTYVWAEQGSKVAEYKDPDEKPRKKQDHAMDALRYFFTGHFGLASHVGYQD